MFIPELRPARAAPKSGSLRRRARRLAIVTFVLWFMLGPALTLAVVAAVSVLIIACHR